MIEPYFMRWAISNLIVLFLLFLCWKYPRYGGTGYGVIFLSAAIVNALTALLSPLEYLEYRDFAIFGFYKTFIEGFFANNIQIVVLIIALGQLLIAVGLFYGKGLIRPAIIGAIVFSIGIIPLGIGSGMPVPILMIIALWILHSKHAKSHPNVIT